jgi:hypothetical protein
MTQTIEKELFIGYRDEQGEYFSYESDRYKLSEIDFLNLIKICMVEGRNKTVGKKLLEVYHDITAHEKEIARKKLELIGIKENGDRNPNHPKKTIYR